MVMHLAKDTVEVFRAVIHADKEVAQFLGGFFGIFQRFTWNVPVCHILSEISAT